jgi:hypothetical protein
MAKRKIKLIRVGRKTPSYDSMAAHWDSVLYMPDGSFFGFGTKLLKGRRHIYQITVSEYPYSSVTMCGRRVSGPGRQPEFLSVRMGALEPRYVPLSDECTALLHISIQGDLFFQHRVIDVEEFQRFCRNLPSVNTRSSVQGYFQELVKLGLSI